MRTRTLLPVLLTLGVQASLSASTLYNLGTLNNISFADESNGSGSNAYVAGVWTETFTGTLANTTQQIVCVVALAGTSDVCGNGSGGNGPGSAGTINIPGAPTGTGILPVGVTNYIMIDGDNTYGAPVSSTLTGLATNTQYTVTFYQATNEESGNTQQDTDKWQVYVIPGTTPAYITATNGVDSSKLVYTSTPTTNNGGVATPWQQQTFSFTTGASTSAVLEFVTNAVATGGGGVLPPMLDLAGVSYSLATPEPGSGMLLMIGGGLCAAAAVLRRKSPAKR